MYIYGRRIRDGLKTRFSGLQSLLADGVPQFSRGAEFHVKQLVPATTAMPWNPLATSTIPAFPAVPPFPAMSHRFPPFPPLPAAPRHFPPCPTIGPARKENNPLGSKGNPKKVYTS